MQSLTRRSVLNGIGLATAAACAGYLVIRRSDAASPSSSPGTVNAYGAPAPTNGELLTAVDDLPAGGGIVLDKRKLVLTRDEQGTVRGFSATCTHQGCTVDGVKEGVIECPCHGSRFDAVTGKPVQGPARQPLREVPVVVRDGNVFTS